MSVHAMNHFTVLTDDVDRTVDFYGTYLGLKAGDRPDLGFPGAWYALGTSQIHLIQQAKIFDDIDPTDPHVALEVDDLAAVRRTLDARGIPYRDFGGTQLWIRDPDGNVVELCERT